MTAGVDKTLATLQALGSLSVDSIAVFRAGGFKLSVLPKLFDAMHQISVIAADAPAALPELSDLDSTEAAQVGAAAFDLVKQILAALA